MPVGARSGCPCCATPPTPAEDPSAGCCFLCCKEATRQLTTAPLDTFLFAWSDAACATVAYAIVRVTLGLLMLGFALWSATALRQDAGQAATQLTTWFSFLVPCSFLLSGVGGLGAFSGTCTETCAACARAPLPVAERRMARVAASDSAAGAARVDAFVLAQTEHAGDGSQRQLSCSAELLPVYDPPRRSDLPRDNNEAAAAVEDARAGPAQEGGEAVGGVLGGLGAAPTAPPTARGDGAPRASHWAYSAAGEPLAAPTLDTIAATGPVIVTRSAVAASRAQPCGAHDGAVVRVAPLPPPLPPQQQSPSRAPLRLRLFAIALHDTAVVLAAVVTVLFWAGATGAGLGSGASLASTLIKHALYCALVCGDLALTRAPTRPWGVLRPLALGAVYVAATGVYALARKEGPYEPGSKALNWRGSGTAAAIGAGVGIALLAHALAWLLARGRTRAARACRKRRARREAAAL